MAIGLQVTLTEDREEAISLAKKVGTDYVLIGTTYVIPLIAATIEKFSSADPKTSKRPKLGGVCAQAWATYDELTTRNGKPCSISEALTVLRSKGVNDHTIKTQYYQWRKYNGISGRDDLPTFIPGHDRFGTVTTPPRNWPRPI